jgi:hypothetical protein
VSAERVTLLFRKNKREPWREIGVATGYYQALLLGERAGLKGGHWWFRTREPEPATTAAKTPTLFDGIAEADVSFVGTHLNFKPGTMSS